MTAHRTKPVTLTPELVARFAEYHRRHPGWGVFHVSLEDGNHTSPAADPATDEERALARAHDLMTPSQRARLARRT